MHIKQILQALQLLHGMVETIQLNGLERDQVRQATSTIQQALVELQQLREQQTNLASEHQAKVHADGQSLGDEPVQQ